MEINELLNFCHCVQDATEEDLAELVNVVSMATGWMRSPCETFLTGQRREVIDLPSCSDCPITFDPYYRPYDVNSFKFYLVSVDGLEETVTEITEFQYHVSDGLFHIDTGLPSCKCQTASKCDGNCPKEYRLLAEYTAGYDEIPDCLANVFCNLLEVIVAKNKCDCNDCGCDNEKEDNVKYASGDIVTVALETDLGKVLVEQYKKQLGMMSIVRRPSDIWGFAV